MILFISMYKFPEGDAGSERMLYLAQAYQYLGKKVLIIGHGDVTKEIKLHKGVPYFSLRKDKRIKSYLFFSLRLITFLNSFLKSNFVDTIIFGNTQLLTSIYLKNFGLKHNVKLIHDSVEWFSPHQYMLKWISPFYILSNYEISGYIDKNVSSLSISTYLDEYFKSKGVKSERVPVVFNQDYFQEYTKPSNDKLKVLYAGQMGKKDYMIAFIMGMSLLSDSELEKLEFTIIGVNREALITQIPLSKQEFGRIEGCMNIMGRKQMRFVREELKKNDFGVLIRDGKFRNVQAGFSTKVVEGASLSTPFIMNFTSDLGLYFVDGYNCLEVKQISPKGCASIIRKAIGLSKFEKQKLSKNVKQTAIKYFGIHSCKDELIRLLE